MNEWLVLKNWHLLRTVTFWRRRSVQQCVTYFCKKKKKKKRLHFVFGGHPLSSSSSCLQNGAVERATAKAQPGVFRGRCGALSIEKVRTDKPSETTRAAFGRAERASHSVFLWQDWVAQPVSEGRPSPQLPRQANRTSPAEVQKPL